MSCSRFGDAAGRVLRGQERLYADLANCRQTAKEFVDVNEKSPSRAISTAIVGGLCGLLFAYLVMIVVVVPRELERFLGLALFAFGSLNVVLHRRIGTRVFS